MRFVEYVPSTLGSFTSPAAMVVAAAVFAGTALHGATYVNADVTLATLDEGGAENIVTANRNLFGITVGSTTNGNSLNVSNGAVMRLYDFSVGFGSYDTVGDPTLGCNNSLVVDGAGTRLQDGTTSSVRWVDVCVGNMGSYNSATFSGGVVCAGDITIGNGLVAYLSSVQTTYAFPNLGCHNSVVVTGEGTKMTGQLRVGVDGSCNSLRVEDGAAIDAQYTMFIGVPTQITYTSLDPSSGISQLPTQMGCDNSVVVTGVGSRILLDGEMVIGYNTQNCLSQRNTLTIGEGALVAVVDVDAENADADGNLVRLGAGYLALLGDRTTDLETVCSYLRVPSGEAWVQPEAESLAAVFFPADAAGDADAKTATANLGHAGYDDLGGYTLVCDPCMLHPDVSWADGVFDCGGWCGSYYGNFYTSRDFSGWIWHQNHGWQYVEASSTSGCAYVWDGRLGWLFTAKDFYPFVYSYDVERWYFYLRGTFPARVFWDCLSEGEVNEVAIGAQ